MQIGELAERTGVPAKTIRYYETIGLVAPATRDANGYRRYSLRDAAVLGFVQRARSLGFPVKDVAALLALWRDRARASADVRGLAIEHIGRIDAKLRELQAMRAALVDLTERCHGDDRPDCPILEDLAAS